MEPNFFLDQPVPERGYDRAERGQSVIAHLWTLILFGDYMAYYLAMAYGADPSEEYAILKFKRSL